ncbi:MAG TPA: DNA repair protein RadC [Methanoregulaceae archaeon]|nr:DNA repair protein RadC [Methanoregulaceae archaeon]
MKKMMNVPERDRPREKIRRLGPAALSDQELIAAIIGRGVRGTDVFSIAGELAKELRSGREGLTYEKMEAVHGMGPAKAAQLSACFELSRRYPEKDQGSIRVTRPEDIINLLNGLEFKKQEHFVCITLNGAGEVLGNRIITVGLLNHSLVHPREVFADAITDRAASIICVHNHPSGTLEPSTQDLEVTRQLTEAGGILGIRVLDHVIVTRNGFLSMKERGLL